MDDNTRKLIENNMGLAYYVVNKWVGKIKNSYEDILSDCLFGLVKAGKSFDESKGFAFATFAIRCMDNEVYMSLRKEKLHHREECFSNLIQINQDGQEFDIFELIPECSTNNVEDWINNEVLKEDLRIAMMKLSPREKEILCAYSEGINQRSIANIYGFSQSYISRILQNSRNKIHRCMK